jgi:hypothetical protein
VPLPRGLVPTCCSTARETAGIWRSSAAYVSVRRSRCDRLQQAKCRTLPTSIAHAIDARNHNQVILEGAADKVQQALIALGVEIVALAVALVVTILD